MMNYIGKFFVLVYGVGALFCLIFAMAVYTQKMDFVTPKGETSKKFVTRIDTSMNRTKDLLAANQRAITRWTEAIDDLVPREVDQTNRREYYRSLLALVATGQYTTDDPNYKAVDVPDPVQELGDHDPNSGLLAIDKPTMRKVIEYKTGQNLRPHSVYRDDIGKTGVAMTELLGAIDDLQKRHQDADKIIQGVPGNKGLRVRTNEQRAIGRDADSERIYLEDAVTNRRAEAQLFVKRRDAVQASIKRLVEYYERKNSVPMNKSN